MSDKLHKDQQRVKDAVLPYIMQRVMAAGDVEAERDCTLLNRLLVQGPDPLFIMEAAPAVFARLCEELGVNVDDGRKAIEAAHWQGPGALLDGTGLTADKLAAGEPTDAMRTEALWLVLAACSDCTEEGYVEDVGLMERVRRAQEAPMKVIDLLGSCWEVALDSMQEFIDTTEFTPDPRFGKPMATADHGFYVGYKLGHPCVAVQAGDLTFYGTVPGTTLAEQGVEVSKEISPQFGIIFG